MSQLTLQMDPEALREATTQAIMGKLTPEMQAEMIRTSIQNLLTPSTNSWEQNKSPLQVAFNNAVQRVAGQVAMSVIEGDAAVRAEIDKLLRDVADRVLKMDREKLAERMADAFIASLRTDR